MECHLGCESLIVYAQTVAPENVASYRLGICNMQHKHGVYCHAVFVRPSITFVYFVEMSKQ